MALESKMRVIFKRIIHIIYFYVTTDNLAVTSRISQKITLVAITEIPKKIILIETQ